MIKLKEGKPQELEIAVGYQGLPYEKEVSFGVLADGELVFQENYTPVDGKIQVMLPPGDTTKKYTYVIESDDGFIQERPIEVYAPKMRDIEAKKQFLEVDIDSNWDENTEELLGAANEVYSKGKVRVDEVEKGLGETRETVESKAEEIYEYILEDVVPIITEVKQELEKTREEHTSLLEQQSDHTNEIRDSLNTYGTKQEIDQKLAYIYRDMSDVRSYTDNSIKPLFKELKLLKSDSSLQELGRGLQALEEKVEEMNKGITLHPSIGKNIQPFFSSLTVSGQDTLDPQGPFDRINFAAGSNITLTTDKTTRTVTIASSGGGGGTPGGSNTQVQYNNAGAFGGMRVAYTETGTDSKLRHTGAGDFWIENDESSGAFYLAQDTGQVRVYTRSNEVYGMLDMSGVLANRTYTFQDASGTVAFLSDITGGGCSFGTEGQIPYMNATDDDFDYSSGFKRNIASSVLVVGTGVTDSGINFGIDIVSGADFAYPSYISGELPVIVAADYISGGYTSIGGGNSQADDTADYPNGIYGGGQEIAGGGASANVGDFGTASGASINVGSGGWDGTDWMGGSLYLRAGQGDDINGAWRAEQPSSLYGFGEAANGYYGVLDFSDIDTADKTFVLPNASGTVALTSDIKPYTTSTDSGTSLTLAGVATTATVKVFTGASNTTWTLPAVSGNTDIAFILKNRGTANIALNRAGSDNIYYNSAITSITIYPGESYTVINDGTYRLIV